MKNIRQIQEHFMHYILTGDKSSLYEDIVENGLISVETQMHIYFNAYNVRLRETIETDHEILGFYLGDELFDQMVVGYVAKYPSTYTSLREFTIHLPRYLQEEKPFADHPILSEIARFERMLLDVFDALDVDRIDLDELRRLPPEKWPEMQLRFHPSVQLFRSEWNSVESWNALKQGENPEPATRREGSMWLLWRGRDRLSQFRSMSPEEMTIFTAALCGNTFSSLCETLVHWQSGEELVNTILAYLTDWIENGIVRSIEFEKKPNRGINLSVTASEL